MNVNMYARPNGTYGVRNRIAVIPTVACVNHLAEMIAANVDIADAYTHAYGCDQLGYDLELSTRCLERMGTHPNNGACLIIGLGCEEILAGPLCEEIRKQNPNCEMIMMQEVGSTETCVKLGTEICERFAKILKAQERVPVDISNLTIGVECGGSDFTSGIASNPSVGIFTDKLTAAGGKVVFGESTELMGAEEILKNLCETEEVFHFIDNSIKYVEKVAIDMKVDLRGTQPSPGNIDGGLATIEEKSLGGVCKVGKSKIVDGIKFGDKAVKPGVTYVDTPGNDLACTLGLTCAGAQLVIFTTGRGTPMGFAACPVIKMTANGHIAKIMSDNFDIDVSDIVDGEMSVNEGGEKVWAKVMEVIEGAETCAEKFGHKEFALYRVSPVLT